MSAEKMGLAALHGIVSADMRRDRQHAKQRERAKLDFDISAARDRVVEAALTRVEAADAEVPPLDHDEAIALYRKAQKNTEAAARAFAALTAKAKESIE